MTFDVPQSPLGTVTVQATDTAQNSVNKTVIVSSNPSGVTYDSGKNEVFVENTGTDTVSVISDSSNTIVSTITVGNGPFAAAYDPDNGEIFVTNQNSNSVSIISDSSNAVVATTGVGLPQGAAYDSAKEDVMVASFDSGGIAEIATLDNMVSAAFTIIPLSFPEFPLGIPVVIVAMTAFYFMMRQKANLKILK